MASSAPIAGSSAERRADVREAADESVRLVARTGQTIDARLVDRSLRGLRVRTDQADGLQGRLTVLSPGAGAAYLADVVWRRAPFVGLSIARTLDVRTAAGAEADEVRRLWREHVAAR